MVMTKIPCMQTKGSLNSLHIASNYFNSDSIQSIYLRERPSTRKKFANQMMKRFIKLLLFDNRVLLFSYYLLLLWMVRMVIKEKVKTIRPTIISTQLKYKWKQNCLDDHYVHNFPKLWKIDWLNITWETHVDLILIKTSLHAKQAQRTATTCWWAWKNTCIKIMNQNFMFW